MEDLASLCETGVPFYGGDDGNMRGVVFPASSPIRSGPTTYRRQMFWYETGPRCCMYVFHRASNPRGMGMGLAKELMGIDWEMPLSMPDFDRVWEAACARRGHPPKRSKDSASA